MFEAQIAQLKAQIASGKESAYQKALSINPNAPPLPEGSAVGEYGQENVIGLPFGVQLTPQLQQQLKAYQDAGYTLQYREPPSIDRGPLAFITDPLAQVDKDLSLSQNAPLIAALTAAYLSGGTVGGETLAGAEGLSSAGAGLSALDAGMGTYGAASAMPAALGGGAAGLSALDAGMGVYGNGSTIGGAGTASTTGGLTTSQILRGANLVKNLFGGTGMATTAQQQGLGSLLGGLLQQAGGAVQGSTSAAAAEEQARLISDATQRAVSGSQFRPIGTTTRFGTSQFQVDPTTGQLTSAGYTVSPELKAMQDRIMALSSQGLTEAEQAAGRYAPLTAGAQGLFGLGQQYLAQTPEQVAADYMARQQSLLAPGREREFAQLQNRLFQTGRGGLSVGGTGMRPGGGEGLRAASPEMEAYYNAIAQQDAALAAQAQAEGQKQVQFGAGLLGTGANLLGGYTQGITGAYSPFSTGVGIGAQLETLGQAPLDIGAQLGGRSAQAGANVGQSLFQGGLIGARTTQAAGGVSPFGTALTGLANSPEAQQALAQWLSGGSGYGTNTRQLDTNANF